ncbi:MAG: hypothetical protein H6Q04_2043 [Acidobacteria bacterium]|nr:hypothetical protein [Acidobacteriota bacterium]
MNRCDVMKGFKSANGRKPEPSSWGFFQYNGLPPAMCGSGMGSFLWFKSRGEMLDFAVRFQPNVYGRPDEQKEMDEIAQSVATIVEKLRKRIIA